MATINDLIFKDSERRLVAKEEVKILILKDMFENELAELKGNTIETFGFFQILHGKESFTCSLPLTINLNIEDESTDSDGNTILSYTKGAIIVSDLSYFPNVKNTSRFLDMLTTSRVTVDPLTFSDRFVENLSMNGVRLGIPIELVEAMMSELVRNADNPSESYAEALNKNPNAKPLIVRLKDLPRLTSVFSGISFEDIKKTLRYSALLTKKGIKQQSNPIEGILKY